MASLAFGLVELSLTRCVSFSMSKNLIDLGILDF